MVENKKYKVLKQSANKQGQIDSIPSAECLNIANENPCKKHGVWCRIKTRLRLKKRANKKSNPKAREGANLYHDDKTCLITATSRESLLDENEEYTYRGKNVHVAYISDNYKPLREVEEEDFTEIDNYYNCERLSQGGEVPPNDKDAILGKENHHKTLKEILSKKWHGKKAKRVRKDPNHVILVYILLQATFCIVGLLCFVACAIDMLQGIRSGTRNSIKYLQAGTTNINSLFPDATALVGAFSRQNQPV